MSKPNSIFNLNAPVAWLLPSFDMLLFNINVHWSELRFNSILTFKKFVKILFTPYADPYTPPGPKAFLGDKRSLFVSLACFPWDVIGFESKRMRSDIRSTQTRIKWEVAVQRKRWLFVLYEWWRVLIAERPKPDCRMSKHVSILEDKRENARYSIF